MKGKAKRADELKALLAEVADSSAVSTDEGRKLASEEMIKTWAQREVARPHHGKVGSILAFLGKPFVLWMLTVTLGAAVASTFEGCEDRRRERSMELIRIARGRTELRARYAARGAGIERALEQEATPAMARLLGEQGEALPATIIQSMSDKEKVAAAKYLEHLAGYVLEATERCEAKRSLDHEGMEAVFQAYLDATANAPAARGFVPARWDPIESPRAAFVGMMNVIASMDQPTPIVYEDLHAASSVGVVVTMLGREPDATVFRRLADAGAFEAQMEGDLRSQLYMLIRVPLSTLMNSHLREARETFEEKDDPDPEQLDTLLSAYVGDTQRALMQIDGWIRSWKGLQELLSEHRRGDGSD